MTERPTIAGILFGAAYYPEHRDPARWGYDLDQMAGAHVNAVRVGEFAWCRFEPREGVYEFDGMDRFLEQASKRGIAALMCPPMRTPPPWLVEGHPDIFIYEDWKATRFSYGSRYTCCILHPRLRERGLALAERMAAHWASHSAVLGWHLDNEYGDEPDCHCDRCRAAFQTWLERKYISVGELNRRWGTVFWSHEYDAFAQIPTPRHTRAPHNPALQLDWRRFRSDCTVDLAGQQAAAVRKHARPTPFVTTNNQILNTRVDYNAMAPHLDVHGLNYYPPFGADAYDRAWALANVRGYQAQNFLILEAAAAAHHTPGRAGNNPGPGEVERLAVHCVANGADGLFFFRWRRCPFGAEQFHSAICGYDGEPTRAYREVARIGERLARLAPRLRGTTVVSEVALLHDYPTRWSMAAHNHHGPPAGLYAEHYRAVYEALRGAGVMVDAVGCGAAWERYRVLVVPFLAQVDDALAARFGAFVAGGGTLVWFPLSGMKDADERMLPGRLHPALSALFGVDVAEFTGVSERETVAFAWQGTTYTGRWFADLPALRGGEALAAFASDWYAGTPAVVERRSGPGRALYVATLPDEAFLRGFLAQTVAQADVYPILATDVPSGIELAERRRDDGGRLLFLINRSAAPQMIDVPGAWSDLWNDEPVSGKTALAGWQVRVLAEEPA